MMMTDPKPPGGRALALVTAADTHPERRGTVEYHARTIARLEATVDNYTRAIE
jgi:hypothetical protein